MFHRFISLAILGIGFGFATAVAASEIGASRDILVTFENTGARASSGGAGAPYRNRKRYKLSTDARRQSSAVAREYGLTQVDHWPIKHLSVYCFVYRVAEGTSREGVIEKLRADARVESAQKMNEFETGISTQSGYDDTFANLQHGLTTLDVGKAHRHSRGRGIRIAVIDSDADVDHEDLRGRIHQVANFAGSESSPDQKHGTAITSVIGALANNAKGIVGIAPEASVELFVACWSEAGFEAAICNSFTLARALDAMLDDPPDLLNLSLTGPHDGLLQRLLQKAYASGVIVVAACGASGDPGKSFPASMNEVIGVGSSAHEVETVDSNADVFAPGEKILVAIPDNAYDFRSGSSLAAAHVTGVVALLLDIVPGVRFATVQSLLEQSQENRVGEVLSVNACAVLHLADQSLGCET